MQDGFTCSLCQPERKGLRMAAYSINPSDSGSVMNNSTITQRPDGTSPQWPGKRQCRSRCFAAAPETRGLAGGGRDLHAGGGK